MYGLLPLGKREGNVQTTIVIPRSASDVGIRFPWVGSTFSCGAQGMRIATAGVRTGLAMTGCFGLARRFVR